MCDGVCVRVMVCVCDGVCVCRVCCVFTSNGTLVAIKITMVTELSSFIIESRGQGVY